MVATTTSRRLLAALLPALVACGDDGDPPPLPDVPDCGPDGKVADAVSNGDCEVQLGTGEEAFGPLAGGEELPLIHGPQGGVHVWGAFRLRGGPREHVHYVDFVLETPGGKRLARTPYCPYLQGSDVVDGWLTEWGHTVVLVPPFDPADLDGTDAVLRVTVDDLGEDSNLCAPTPPACRAAACVRVKLRDAPPAGG